MGQAHCCESHALLEAPEVAEDDPDYVISPRVADAHRPQYRASESIWTPRVAAQASEGFGRPVTRLHSDVLAGDFFKQIVTIIWPQVASVAAKLVEQQFSDTLKEMKTGGAHLVSVVGNMSLNFGSRPPEIRRLLSCRKISLADEEGVEICCHLHWRAEANMTLSVGRGMSFGLKGLSADGLACIVFTPLLEETPIIGGCHFFFCNIPKLELNLTGLANVVPKRTLKSALKKSLRTTVVLPNRLAVRAGAAVIADVPAFKSPAPVGILRVHVVSARNIMKADWGPWGQSDPYCVVSLGMQKHRTATKWDEKNPEWGECADLVVYHHRQLLKLKVFDEDKMKKDDPLGCILPSYTVARLVREQSEVGKLGVQWIPLETQHLQTKRLLGRRNPQDKSNRLAPSEERSAVCLRVQYFRLQPRVHEEDNNLGPQSPLDHAPSVRLPAADVMLLSVKLWRLVGSPACLDKAKGAKVSLIVGHREDDVVQSTRCRQVSPMESHGCAQKDVDAMRKLNQLGIGADGIAATLGFSADTVKTLIDPQYTCFGWNTTLYTLVQDAQTTVKMSIHLEGKWFCLGEPFLPRDFLLDRGFRNKRDIFQVANWPHGDLGVEVSIELGEAHPVTTQIAMQDFEAFDAEGDVLPGEEWSLGAAPEQERNLRPGASDDNL